MTRIAIGVDISKDRLDIHRLPDGQSRSFTNDKAGHKAPIAFIGKSGGRAVFEPTGPYRRTFEAALAKKGLAFVKVNLNQGWKACQTCHRRHHAKACCPRKRPLEGRSKLDAEMCSIKTDTLTLSCSGRRTFLTKNSAASLSGGGRPLPLSSIWRWRNGNDLVSVESAASTRLVAVFMTRSRPRLLAAALIA